MRKTHLVALALVALMCITGASAQEKVTVVEDGLLAIDPEVLDRSLDPVIAITGSGRIIVPAPDSLGGAALAAATNEWLNQGDNLNQLLEKLGAWQKGFNPDAGNPSELAYLNDKVAAWMQEWPEESMFTRVETIQQRAGDLERSGAMFGSGLDPNPEATSSHSVHIEDTTTQGGQNPAAGGCGPLGTQAHKIYCCDYGWQWPPVQCPLCDCGSSRTGCCMYGDIEPG